MFLDKMDIKIEFDDHLVKEQDHLDKNIDFTWLSYWDFLKVLTHDFGQKLEMSSLFFLNKISLEIMSHGHLVRKNALLDYKKMNFTELPYWDFFKGVNPWFWSKIKN